MVISAQDDATAVGTVPAGLRVLVVEDSGLIANKVARTLGLGGCTVVGPVAQLAAALDLVTGERGGAAALDAALLDINLRDVLVYPLAKALQARGVPFLFLTGYERSAIPEAWRRVPRVEKPFEAATLLGALGRLVADGPAQADSAQPPPSAGPFSELDRRAFEAMRTSRDLLMERRLSREEWEAASRR